MLKIAKTFTVWSDELEGIFSPLFFISRPKNQKGFIPLNKLATINPYRQKPKFNYDELVPYVGLPETGNREIKEVVMRPYKEVRGRNIIRKGDILFARIEPSVFNKKYIFIDDLKGHDFAFTSTEFYIVEPNKDTNPFFLFNMFFVEPVYEQIIGKTTGSTGRRRLDKGIFEKVFIPFPSTELQNKIVAFLQEAYEQKKKKETEILKILSSIDDFVLGELGIDMPQGGAERVFQIWSDEIEGRVDALFYKPYLRSLLEQIKNKKHFALGEAIADMSGGATPKVTDDYYSDEGGVPFLRVQNITEMGIKLDDVKFIKPEIHETMLKRSQLKKDDLVFTIIGRPGTVSVVPDNFEGNISQNSVRFHLRDKIDKTKIIPDYVAVFLNTKIGKDLSLRWTAGGAQPALNADIVKKLLVPLPNIEKQEKIISGVKTIYEKVKRLRQEAESVVAGAEKQIEQMILA